MKQPTNHEIAYAILNKPQRLARVLYEAKCMDRLVFIVKSTKVNKKEGDYADANSKTK